MFSFNFGQKFDVNHPPTPLFRGKNRQKTGFSQVTFLFFVSIFFTCLTAESIFFFAVARCSWVWHVKKIETKNKNVT